MSFVDLFSERADQYASARPLYPRALIDFVADAAPATRRAWDCGCGNGQAARMLAERFAAVEATDASSEQIAHAVGAPGVRYSVQPAEATEFEAGCFDAVCVAQALHWFDFDRFWPELMRVLVPRGVFAAWGYDRFHVTPDIDAAFDRTVHSVLAPHWAPQNRLLWHGYREISFPLTRLRTPVFSIELRWSLEALFAYVRTWSAVGRLLAAEGPARWEAAWADVSSLWGNPSRVRQVSMPLHLIAGRHA